MPADRLQECERAFDEMTDRIQGVPHLAKFKRNDLTLIYGVATNERPRQNDSKQNIKDACLEYLAMHHPEFYPTTTRSTRASLNASGAADEDDDEDDEDDDVSSDEEQ